MADSSVSSAVMLGICDWSEGMAANVHAKASSYVDLDVDSLAFTILFVAVLETVFWTSNAFFYLVDRCRVFQEYRIPAAGTGPAPELVQECLIEVLASNFLVRPLLLYLVGHRVVVWSGVTFDPLLLPSAPVWLLQIAWCIAVDDTWFYWGHRLMHHRYLYKHVHKKHHTFKQPTGISTVFAHPVEDLFVNTTATLLGPLLIGSHVSVLVSYAALKLWQSVDAHSGYNLPFPFCPFSALPYMDCAPAHNFHHTHNTGNFGGWFTFWDQLCGTDVSYRRHLR